MMGRPESEAGCQECRSSREGLERLGEDLHRRAIDRMDVAGPEKSLSYQNDLMHVCPNCGTRWLQQYWEIDTPETAYEEFGERYVAWTALDDSDVALIENALSTGVLLPQDQFRDT